MIIACINAYQDEEFIADAIKSVAGQVGRIIVVDGAYEGFPLYKGEPYSTDRTVEIAEDLGCDVVETRKVWKDQVTKRNAYLLGEEGDWYFQIDSDERLHGKLEPGNEDAYKIFCQLKSHQIPMIRMFRHHPGLLHLGAHNILTIDGKILRSEEIDILPGCWVEHLAEKRDPDRKRRKNKYYRKQYHAEKKFRQENGLP